MLEMPASAARLFHNGSSAPTPTTIKSASQLEDLHNSCQAVNRVSNPFRRSPKAPINTTMFLSGDHPNC